MQASPSSRHLVPSLPFSTALRTQVLSEHFPGTTLVPDIRCLEALPEVEGRWLGKVAKRETGSEERKTRARAKKKKRTGPTCMPSPPPPRPSSHTPRPRIPDTRPTAQGIDLVTAGFPCIDVSRAGLRTGLTGRSTGLVRFFVRSFSHPLARLLRPSPLPDCCSLLALPPCVHAHNNMHTGPPRLPPAEDRPGRQPGRGVGPPGECACVRGGGGG